MVQRSCVLVPGPRGTEFDDGRADAQIEAYILSGIELLPQAVQPCLEMVDPRLHGILVHSGSADLKPCGPSVVERRRHRHRRPLLRVPPAVQEFGHDNIGAIGKNISLDGHPVAFDPFYGKPATIDFRRNILDHHPPASVEMLITISRDRGWQYKLWFHR